jgi:hypothetical protein
MQDRIFGDREKAMEEAYFRQEDAKLLETLRQKAHLDDIAVALGEKLQVDNPDLLQRVRDVGVTLETAAALFVAPLVQVAWGGGSVTKTEHHTVLRLARERGIEVGSPAYAQLEEWLKRRPDDALFDTAVEVLKYGFSVLPPIEREERIKRIVDACHEVAESSGTTLGFVLGLKNLMGLQNVSESEAATLDAIVHTLRRPARLP